MIKRVALLDLGSNAVRIEIFELGNQPKDLKMVFRQRKVVRLGQGVKSSGRLNLEAQSRTLEALKEFSNEIKKWNAKGDDIDRVVAVGTWAIRSSENGQEFIDRAFELTRIKVHPISGQQEATLISEGISLFEPDFKNDCLLIDIGGGSTEVTLFQDGEICASTSLPIGVVSAQEEFLKTYPPSWQDAKGLQEEIRKLLKEGLFDKIHSASDHPTAELTIGSSGTVKALPSLLNEKSKISIAKLQELKQELSTLTLSQLKECKGMEENRADVITAGLEILTTVMKEFESDTVKVTPFTLRHGILREFYEKGDFYLN